MDYSAALNRLRSAISRESSDHSDFLTLELRLRECLDEERIMGPSERTRAEKAQVLSELNRIALRVMRTSFNDLCLRALANDSIPPVVHNLPQLDFGEFVGREAEVAQIIRTLRPYPHSQYPLITVDGVGGVGKTALALHVANYYLRQFGSLSPDERFDAIVWTSAKQSILTSEGIRPRRPALRTLDDICRTIAVTLNFIDKLHFPLMEDDLEIVRHALTQKRTLLVVDNLETVDDESVMAFLREVPAPTKVVVTTRHRVDVAYPVRLVGMLWCDALKLIEHECGKKSVRLTDVETKRLFTRTGGLPLAIVWTIGQMGIGHNVNAVLDRLGDAKGDVAHFCFGTSVDKIRDSPACRLLLALALFDHGASREELGDIADLSEVDRDEGLAELEKLSLANREGARFWLLPLTKAFLISEFSAYSPLVEEIQNRWQHRFVEVVFEQIELPREKWWTTAFEAGLIASIGRADEQRIQYLRLATGTTQHALIAGRTGSGKSNLLHTIICSLGMSHSPKDLEMYLLDLKEGAELSDYANYHLPHARVIAGSCDREFALSTLVYMSREMSRRAELFRTIGASSIAEYRVVSADELPRILLVIDEFQMLFWENDTIAAKAVELLASLVRMGRAFGIHLVLSTQSLSGQQLPPSFWAAVAVRVALACHENDSRIILGENNPAATYLSHPGEAILNENNGSPEANVHFQVARLDKATRVARLQQIAEMARIAGTQIKDVFIFSHLPRLEANPLLNAALSADGWKKAAHPAKVWLGEPIDLSGPVSVSFPREPGSSLLVMTNDEDKAAAILTSVLVSLAVNCNPDSLRSYLVDLSTFGIKGDWVPDYLAEALPHGPHLLGRRDVGTILSEIARSCLCRGERSGGDDEEIFLIIHGIHRAQALWKSRDFSPTLLDSGTDALRSCLDTVLRIGPDVGVHVIAWCDCYQGLLRSLTRRHLDYFGKRVICDASEEDTRAVLDGSLVRTQYSVLYDAQSRRTSKFIPYQIPPRDWITMMAGRLAQRAASNR